MIRSQLGTYSLFFVIIFFGMLLGGAAYEHLVFFPVYFSALPDSAVMVNGKYGLHTGIFWMLIHPTLILSLLTTLALNWRIKPRRVRILITVAVYFSIIVLTQIYFLPELAAFRHSPESSMLPAEWLVRTQRWLSLSWLRGIVMYIATFPLLLALTKPATVPEELQAESRLKGSQPALNPSENF